MRTSMKTNRSWLLFVVLCLGGASSTARSQSVSVVNFANSDILHGINAPFYDVDGTTRLAGTNYRAALYFGAPDSPPESFVVTTAASQPFGTGLGAGYWRSSQIRLTGIAGERVGLQVRFWDTENDTFLSYEQAKANSGTIGVSPAIIVTLDSGEPPSATPMIGLQSASLVPTTITLTRGAPNFVTYAGVASGRQLTNLCGVPVGPNRWFRLASPYSGTAILTTAGSEMDTVMGAFQGSIVNPSAMTPITCNDDFAASVTSSQLRFPLEANTLYLLCVAGKNGGTNAMRLSHTLATELQIRRMGLDRVELSWPADATNCAAEAAASLHGTWQTMTNAPVTVTNRKVLTLGSGAGEERLYRLRLSPAP